MSKLIIKRSSYILESIQVFSDRVVCKKPLKRNTIPISKIANVETTAKAPSPFSQIMMLVGRWLIVETTGGKKADVFLSRKAAKEVENEIIKLID